MGVEIHGLRLTLSFLHRLFDGHLAAAQQRGLLPGDELAGWWRTLEAADREGRLVVILVAVLASGRVTTGEER